MNTRKTMDEQGKFLLVQAGAVFALPIASVMEVLPYVALMKTPMTASFVAGTVNVGGVVVTVLDLGDLLDSGAAPANVRSHIIRLNGAVPLALRVERALAAIDARSVSIFAVDTRNTFNGLVRAELRRGDGTTAHLLDIDALLTEEERRRFADFGALEQARLEGLEAG